MITRCLQPIYLKDVKTSVPCGKCPPCRRKKSQEWQFRLYQEYKHAETSYFLTITYDEENQPTVTDKETGEILSNLEKRDLQLFLKALRNYQTKLEDEHLSYFKSYQNEQKRTQIRYYAVGEYGDGTERAHYHMLIFNLDPKIERKLNDIWKKGHVHTGTCNAKTIAYTLKYVLKTDTTQSPNLIQNPQFSIQSRRPAIGHQYLESNKNYHLVNRETTVRDVNGKKIPIPRYYRDKIFTELTRKVLSKKAMLQSDLAELDRELELIKKGLDPGQYQNEEVKDYLRKIVKQQRIKRQKL